MNGKKNRSQLAARFIANLAIIVLLNVISAYIFTRIDLSTEKRFSISEASKNLARNLEDVVFVKVYLEGDFPAGFKRLRKATKEMLDEFRSYSKGNIEYEFINPSENPDKKERNKLYNQLAEKGLQPTNLEVKEGDALSQKIIFPGALFTYISKEIPLQLLKSKIGASPEEMLNNSIQSLEYDIANTIRKLTVKKRPSVAFIEGHGELDTLQVADITKILGDYYAVDRVKISGRIIDEKLENNLLPYNVIVIAKPDSVFSESEKFLLDQYIMKGGKVLWLVDGMDANMDSLANENSVMSLGYDLNLGDMLFKYGIRINPNIILDLQCAPIPLITGIVGNQPKTELVPWFYFPMIFPESNHPVVNNLNAIKFDFASTIDTIGVAGLRKTILLHSSKYTKVLYSPVRVSLAVAKQKPATDQYNKKYQPVAVLVEGNFESNFTQRIPESLMQYEIDFREKSELNKMIVVSDGDVIKNQVRRSAKKFYPLGYDIYSGQFYGNRNFILNAIDYLCDESGLISVRSKELKLRLLNKTRIEQEKLMWQVLNILMPIAIVLFFGITKYYLRKRKFAS